MLSSAEGRLPPKLVFRLKSSSVEVVLRKSVEQELGDHHQAAGDIRVLVDVGLEAGHDDLERNEPDSALPADDDHALVVDGHGHLYRRAELIMTHNYWVIDSSVAMYMGSHG